MIVYIYGKCSTCQNALRFLEKHDVVFTIKEITKEPPSIFELQTMLAFQNQNLKKLFNSSGLLYKEMQIKDKLSEMSLNESLELLHRHGMLVKRPFLLSDSFGLTGFNEVEWSKYIK